MAKSENKANDRLREALHALNGAPSEEVLSEDARRRIFSAVREDSGPTLPLARLFVPLRRRVVAAALPAVLAGGFVALLTWGPGGENPAAPSVDRVLANKVGDYVVFTVVNGGEDHRVARSSRPDAFGQGGDTIAARGRFVDRLDGPDLVFYRID